ncbi:hypothetical protein E2C01_043868 [Portunus trituberculatus]|uniref:Uncharacterized protein n=1 Tax=Portunus trituberculatus TaxID=210409 RepID=A0A5B7FWU1_PORTR|nr:hypothetical protein [Portunus trituberculatus]
MRQESCGVSRAVITPPGDGWQVRWSHDSPPRVGSLRGVSSTQVRNRISPGCIWAAARAARVQCCRLWLRWVVSGEMASLGGAGSCSAGRGSQGKGAGGPRSGGVAGALTDGDPMYAARGGPKGDVCHPSSAPGARLPPASMQAPASARSLPGSGGGANPSGHLTKPSPRSLHLQQLPSRFTRLGRSPDVEKPDRVWTVRGETGTGPPGPNDVIITDICLNHNPELSLNTSSVRSRQQPDTTSAIQQLSVVDLQNQLSQGPFTSRQAVAQTNPLPREVPRLGCSFFGVARAFLGRMVTQICSGDLCGGQGAARQTDPEREEVEEPVNHQQAEQVPEGPQDTTQRVVDTQETPRGYDNPIASPPTTASGIRMTPEVVVTPEKSGRKSQASWAMLSDLVRLQHSALPTSSSSADVVYSSPGAASHLQVPQGRGGKGRTPAAGGRTRGVVVLRGGCAHRWLYLALLLFDPGVRWIPDRQQRRRRRQGEQGVAPATGKVKRGRHRGSRNAHSMPYIFTFLIHLPSLFVGKTHIYTVYSIPLFFTLLTSLPSM